MYFLKCPCLKGSFLFDVVVEVTLCSLSGTWWQCRLTVKLLVRLMGTPDVMLS